MTSGGALMPALSVGVERVPLASGLDSKLRSGLLWERGIVPATLAFHDALGFGRSPGAGLVLEQRRGILEDWIDHAPCCLDAIIAREERPVAAYGVAEQTRIRGQVLARMLVRDKLRRLA